MAEDVTVPRKLLATLADTVGRMRFMQKAGFQYGTNRDIWKTAGYPKDLEFSHYWSMYRRGDIAGRIVDMAPQTTWRTPPEIVEPGMDPEKGTNFTNEFKELAQRLHLWSRFERVDRMAGIGRYAVLLIGTRGDDDRALKEELTSISNPEDIIYLGVHHEGVSDIKTWVKDPTNPRFGLPETYEIDLSSGVKEFGDKKLVIHATRIIHVAEDLTADEVFGRPRLERIYNRLADLEKISASTGEAYWQLASRVLAAQASDGAEIPDEVAADMKEQLEEITHDLRRIFIGQGVDLDWLNSTPPDPSKVTDLYFTLIAGAAGYPKRVLFGSETGERASEQDQRQFLGIINERQERFAEPFIVRAFIDRMIEIGALSAPGEDGYEVLWPPLWEESEKEKAEANKIRAEAAKALTPVGGDPLDLVEVDDNRDIWLLPTAPIEERLEEKEDEEEVPEGQEEGPDETPPPDEGEGDEEEEPEA